MVKGPISFFSMTKIPKLQFEGLARWGRFPCSCASGADRWSVKSPAHIGKAWLCISNIFDVSLSGNGEMAEFSKEVEKFAASLPSLLEANRKHSTIWEYISLLFVICHITLFYPTWKVWRRLGGRERLHTSCLQEMMTFGKLLKHLTLVLRSQYCHCCTAGSTECQQSLKLRPIAPRPSHCWIVHKGTFLGSSR